MSETTEQPTTEELTGTAADVFGEEIAPEAPPTPEPSPPPPPSSPTAEQIRESVRQGVQDATAPPPQRQYTPEELNRMFNVWEPSEELVQKVLNGGQDAISAMQAIRDGLARQFGTLLQYQMEVVKQELSERMAPALTFAQEQAAAKDREDFFSQNEDLRDHEQLTQTVFDALKTQGYRAPDKATAYKTLADRTRALLGVNGAGAGQPSGARKTTPTQTKRPAQLSSGSQAGGGGPSAPAVPFPGAEVFM